MKKFINIKYNDFNNNLYTENIEIEDWWTDYYIRDWFFNLKNRKINYTSIIFVNER